MSGARSGVLAAALCATVPCFACHGQHADTRAVDAAPIDAVTDAREAAASAPAPTPDAAPPDDTLPSGHDDDMSTRARHLLEAITHDDATLATDIVFPRDGWLATRDAPDPGKEWQKKVDAPFRRAIHALSRKHAEFDRAQLVSFELGHSMTQETPKRHAWKKPLWTIVDSKLTFTVDGKVHTLSIRAMVAWRGAWYVTRLR